jgi:hypothetical protein
MDLLHHYDSSSDSDDETQAGDCGGAGDSATEKRSACTTSTTDTGTTEANKKRKGSVTIVSNRDLASQSLFVRAQPHVRGNWAGHIYVSIPIQVPEDASSSNTSNSPWQSAVDESVATFRDDLERAGFSGTLVHHDHFHLSLSRNFYLQVASIDSFVEKLTARLSMCPATTVRILANNSDSNNNILVNDEKTRSFWTWSVQANAALLHIVQSVNAVLESYNQPAYYDPPSFHVSLASFATADTTATTTDTTADTADTATATADTTANAATDTAVMDQHLQVQRMQRRATNTGKKETQCRWFPLAIREIQCTFGTTKSYTIPLFQYTG